MVDDDDERLRSLVALHVQGEVVRAREAAVAMIALERFRTCVFPVMTGQLVRPCEPPLAALPRTLVRLLTCKRNSKTRH